MHSNLDMIYRLQVALNSKGLKVLCNRSQFYSDEEKRPVTLYKITQAVFDSETGKNKNVELFSAYSQIQIVLFMRNFWFLVNDKPIPPTNDMKGAEQFKMKWAEFEERWKLSNKIE